MRPSGEIFAVNTSSAVQWANISCVNFTAAVNVTGVNSPHKLNLSVLSQQFSMNRTLTTLENLSKDAFNYTFNVTYEDTFQVGQVKIGDDEKDTENCHQLFTFVDDAYQTANFKEVLLFDTLSALVFTTFLYDSISGYQADGNDLHDFQLMVAEDGSPGKEAASTYYFYVELD